MLDSIEIQEAPSVYPTLEDMSDFQKYTQQLEKLYSKDFGMVKVVAPKDYCPRKQDYTTSIEHLQIPSPIEQNLHGKGGIYECLHLIKKSLQIKEFVKRSAKIQPNIEGKTSLEVEKLFWKNASFSPPIYGADFQKSLFDQGCIWNLCELDTILKKGVSQALSGVTEPYLYVGQWKSLFAWHKEDYDLGAINYLHYGQPKFWYCVSSDNGHLLEKCAKLYFQESFTKCSEFLRHKTGIINPYIIKKKFPEIKISKIQHNPREFIIIFNGAYHHGFNFGYNIAESVNFATNSWLTEHFLKANKQCLCNKGVVRMNHMEFYDNIVKNHPELKNQPFIKKFHELLIQGGFDKQKDYLQKLLEEKQSEQIEEQQQQNTNETIINQHHHTSDENSLSDSTIKKNEKEIKIISKKIDKKRVNAKKNQNKEKKQQNLKNNLLLKAKTKKDQDIDLKQKDVEKYEIELNQENKIILKKNQKTEIQLTKKIKKQENKHKNNQKIKKQKKKEKKDEDIRNKSEESLQMSFMEKSNDIMSEDLTDNQIQEYLPKNDYNMFQTFQR
ncbi:hypothetical protein PPERSA_06486 [Pseudocohnilembus persalinus]|uniref:JmjC domain-containing protein n=1 Tax=Pseudocohnilembus persalinus TaxID=266149 RepID=A0A0V0QRF0_PSEPJ|nr:hypothetical protein PPERSA_06486 [Pseudocohnilembus persalinus]|eukprot:KRX04852.1 hypothetical protein PPERSA_06486 [Pseudocohnilembus persalinus]